MSTVGMTRFQPVMTEVERQRLFLERAASVLAERVLQLEEVVQERIYRNLEELYLEKDDPLQTTDDEFEGHIHTNNGLCLPASVCRGT